MYVKSCEVMYVWSLLQLAIDNDWFNLHDYLVRYIHVVCVPHTCSMCTVHTYMKSHTYYVCMYYMSQVLTAFLVKLISLWNRVRVYCYIHVCMCTYTYTYTQQNFSIFFVFFFPWEYATNLWHFKDPQRMMLQDSQTLWQ